MSRNNVPQGRKRSTKIVKNSRKSAIKSLHGALKGLLKDARDKNGNGKSTIIRSTLENSTGDKYLSSNYDLGNTKRKHNKNGMKNKDDIIYIMSKEKVLIPKLTDDEVMERHKRADQTMKEVWTNIINKYENIQDQGDLIDLRTGEIIEDHGHINGLNKYSITDERTTYKSSLRDILFDKSKNNSNSKSDTMSNYDNKEHSRNEVISEDENDINEYSIWQEDPNEDNDKDAIDPNLADQNEISDADHSSEDEETSRFLQSIHNSSINPKSSP